MKNKEYEMPAEYQQSLEFLTAIIRRRDEVSKILPTLPPQARAKTSLLLRQLNAQIEVSEQSLAKQYEQYQKSKRLEEEEENLFKQAEEISCHLHVYLKYAKPHKFQAFLDSVYDDWSDEEMQEILDAVAILETTKLKEILRDEMPPPEKIAELFAAGETAFKNRKKISPTENQD